MEGPLTTMIFPILTCSNTMHPLRPGSGANFSMMLSDIPLGEFSHSSLATLSTLHFLSFCRHESPSTLQWRKRTMSLT